MRLNPSGPLAEWVSALQSEPWAVNQAAKLLSDKAGRQHRLILRSLHGCAGAEYDLRGELKSCALTLQGRRSQSATLATSAPSRTSSSVNATISEDASRTPQFQHETVLVLVLGHTEIVDPPNSVLKRSR